MNYAAGSYVLASNMLPRDRKRAEVGELDHLLEPASLEDAENEPVGEPDRALFVPEHEAEAHILEQYGHQVVPREQELEVLSTGAERAAQYQEAVKEHGLDERPVQAANSEPRESVPAEALEGHETRTGLPTDREPHIESPRQRPGEKVYRMAVTGVIADAVRGIIPITWDALSKDSRIGDAPLQRAIDLSKETVTGTIIATGEEGTYPVIVVDYIAKLATIEIAQAGVDFWMNQTVANTSTGTNEVTTYVDRAAAMDRLRQELILETRAKQPEISKLVGYYLDEGRAVPAMSSASLSPFHLTPSPEEFPRPYRQTQYS